MSKDDIKTSQLLSTEEVLERIRELGIKSRQDFNFKCTSSLKPFKKLGNKNLYHEEDVQKLVSAIGEIRAEFKDQTLSRTQFIDILKGKYKGGETKEKPVYVSHGELNDLVIGDLISDKQELKDQLREAKSKADQYQEACKVMEIQREKDYRPLIEYTKIEEELKSKSDESYTHQMEAKKLREENTLRKELLMIQDEYSRLGWFSGTKKKELTNKINALRAKIG